jgi:hypothetical protein
MAIMATMCGDDRVVVMVVVCVDSSWGCWVNDYALFPTFRNEAAMAATQAHKVPTS